MNTLALAISDRLQYEKERWITIGGGAGQKGTHVKIDDDGNIVAGPKRLKGENLDSLPDSESQKPAPTLSGNTVRGRQWVEAFDEVRADRESASDAELWRAAVFTGFAQRVFNQQSDAGMISEAERDEVWEYMSKEHDALMDTLRERVEPPEASDEVIVPPEAESPQTQSEEPPEALGAGVRHLPDGRAVGTTQLTVDQLSFDPGRFQYKIEGVNDGVSDKLKDVTAFNPAFAGQLQAWKDPGDGEIYVVNGHHRFELARRLGHKEPLSVYLVDAQDAQEARAVGALSNLAEGNGTALDAAKFLRDAQKTPDDLQGIGISLKGKMASDAMELSKLSDRIFSRVAGGVESTNRAIAIAKHIDDHDIQNELYAEIQSYIDKGKRLADGDVEELARETAAEATITEKQGVLWGTESKQRTLRPERAKLKRLLRSELEQRLRAFGAVTTGNRSQTLADAGNVLDDDRNRQIAQEAKEQLWEFDQLINTRGPINDLITTAATELAANPRNSKRIAAQLADAVRQQLGAFGRAVPAFGQTGSGTDRSEQDSLSTGPAVEPLEGITQHKPAPNQRGMFQKAIGDALRLRYAKQYEVRDMVRLAYAKPGGKI